MKIKSWNLKRERELKRSNFEKKRPGNLEKKTKSRRRQTKITFRE